MTKITRSLWEEWQVIVEATETRGCVRADEDGSLWEWKSAGKLVEVQSIDRNKVLYDLAWSYIRGSEVTDRQLDMLDFMILRELGYRWDGSRTGSYALLVEKAAKKL
jgi:hypothetical protein